MLTPLAAATCTSCVPQTPWWTETDPSREYFGLFDHPAETFLQDFSLSPSIPLTLLDLDLASRNFPRRNVTPGGSYLTDVHCVSSVPNQFPPHQLHCFQQFLQLLFFFFSSVFQTRSFHLIHSKSKVFISSRRRFKMAPIKQRTTDSVPGSESLCIAATSLDVIVKHTSSSTNQILHQ